MEPNMTQEIPSFSMPIENPQSAIPPPEQMVPTGMQKRSSFGSCLWALIPLALLIIFFVYGNKIFSFFHILYIYTFIISVLIILVLYILAITIGSFFLKYPKDLLTLYLFKDRN